MSKTAEILAALYALVPKMADCKGLCQDSCSGIALSDFERARLGRSGVEMPTRDREEYRAPCPALTAKGRCSVYAARPMICRTWGTSPRMACEHGCRPVEWLSDAQAFWLLLSSFQAGGHPDFPRPEVLEQMKEELQDPELRPLMLDVLRVPNHGAEQAAADIAL